MKTFEEVPAGTLFVMRGWHPLDHKPYEVYIKLREPFRWDVPDGSGFMNVNAIKIGNGDHHSVSPHEPIKRVGILLGIKELLPRLLRKRKSNAPHHS